MAFLSPAGEPHVVRKAERFLTLEDAERAQLRSIASGPFHVPRRAPMQERGEPATRMLLLTSGMAAQVVTDTEGRRCSTRFFLPGDMIGAHEMALVHHASDVVAVTDCGFTILPKRAFVHAADTRMWRLFHLFRQVEQVIAADRIGSLARGRADERVLHVLLELHARQRLGLPSVSTTVWLPLTQGEIGEATGLTNVYVSKTMQRLRENGTIRAVTGGRHHCVLILDEPGRLANRIGFTDRYADLDVARAAAGSVGGLLERADTVEAPPSSV